MTRHLLPALLLATFFVSPLAAQTPASVSASHAAAAQAFLEASGVKRLIDASMVQMESMVPQLMPNEIPEEMREEFQRFMGKMTQMMEQEIGYTQMEPMLIEVYSAEFSEAEFAEMTRFYQSPAGAKLAQAGPMLQARLGQLMMPKMQALMPRIEALALEFASRLEKTGSCDINAPEPSSC